MVVALRSGATLSAGIEHQNYYIKAAPLAENVRKALIADLG
jgi:hypothetical protein